MAVFVVTDVTFQFNMTSSSFAVSDGCCAGLLQRFCRVCIVETAAPRKLNDQLSELCSSLDPVSAGFASFHNE